MKRRCFFSYQRLRGVLRGEAVRPRQIGFVAQRHQRRGRELIATRVRFRRLQEHAEVGADVEALENGVQNDLTKKSAAWGDSIAETAANATATCHGGFAEAFAAIGKELLDAATQT